MATEATPAVAKKPSHKCGVCKQARSGQQLKLLPCSHTFCLACLTKVATTLSATTPATSSDNGARVLPADGVSGDADGYGDGSQAMSPSCPTCQSPFTVPKGGLSCLQSSANPDIEEEDEEQGGDPSPSLTRCDMCEQGQAQAATHACDKCHKRMCRGCRRLHDMLTDPHVHRVRPQGHGDLHGPERKSCPHHPDQLLCFHCRRCDISICLHCKLTSHEGHMTEDMVAAARRAKAELTGLVAKANEQIRIIEDSLSSLERDKSEVARQKEEKTRDVKVRCDLLLSWATRARDEFLEGLTTIERALATSFQAEERVSRAAIDALSSLVERAGCISGYGANVVLLKNELKSTLLSDKKLEIHRQGAAQDNRRTFFRCRANTSALRLDMVRVYMGEFQEESGEETEVVAGGSHQSLTLEDLIQEVSELRQRVQGNTKTLTKLKSETDAVEKLAEDIQEEMKAVHKETASLRNGLKDVTELKSRATTNEVAISGLRDETQNLWKETGALKDVLMLQGRVGGYVY